MQENLTSDFPQLDLDTIFPKMRSVLGREMDVTNEQHRATRIVVNLCVDTRHLIGFVAPNYREEVLDQLAFKGVNVEDGYRFPEKPEESELVSSILWAVRSHFQHVDHHILHGHLSHVGKLARMIGQELGMNEDDLKSLYYAGAMHDTGKVDPVVDYVVSKDRKLSHEERLVTRVHAMLSYLVSTMFDCSDTTRRVALLHHERLNGTGYPMEMQNESICDFTRIVTVADIVDAMSDNRRPGRKARNISDIMSELRRWEEDGNIDPKVVAAFFSVCRKLGLHEGKIAEDLHVKSSELIDGYDRIRS